MQPAEAAVKWHVQFIKNIIKKSISNIYKKLFCFSKPCNQNEHNNLCFKKDLYEYVSCPFPLDVSYFDLNC